MANCRWPCGIGSWMDIMSVTDYGSRLGYLNRLDSAHGHGQ